VLGDAERLAQIFRNLVANGIKFTPPDGRVTVSARMQGEDIVVAVTDTGEGIAAEFLPRLFDRFSQSDASITRRHGGLGLGLAIVRHLVALHGGRIEAESPGVGGGATFRVWLRALPRVAERARAGATSAPEPGGGRILDGVRVCLVDDDPETLVSVALMLEQAGAAVTSAGGARAALVAVTSARPDVVVTDLAMPGEDGYWLVEQLRAKGVRVACIALTGFASAETRARVLANGFQGHVAKPVEMHELLATMASVLLQPRDSRTG
jgi:CheY-like chemotaxis protein